MTQQQASSPAGSPERTGTLIIGSGFSGLGMAVELRRRGDTDFVILERAKAVAGTWRDNQYPGCACDVESHLYSYSFEPETSWSRAFAPWDEIRAYIERCTDKYDLRRHVRFDADVEHAQFDEPSGTWTVRTRQGATYRARNVVTASGGLSNPAYPNLPGLDRFEGEKFHSAEWKHDVDLTGKRVAVIGTGASAIQFVPEIQPRVKQLNLFQRTPPWVMPKPDFEFSETRKWLFRHLPIFALLYRFWLYFKNEMRVLAFKNHSTILRALMGLGEKYIAACVKKPELRQKLTPTYTPGCKRILMSNNYYQSLDQANVDVITDGIAEVRPRSIVTHDGRELDVDVIIYGTGFKVQDNLGAMRFIGRNGADLGERWAQGASAYLGTSVPDFPNLYMLLGPNTGLGHTSMILMLESQVRYISHAIRLMKKQALSFIDVRRDVYERYNQWLQERLKDTVWASGCQSWYLNQNGKNTTAWPGFTFTFRWLTRRVRLADYTLQPLPTPSTASSTSDAPARDMEPAHVAAQPG